jgi:hypothetical protein
MAQYPLHLVKRAATLNELCRQAVPELVGRHMSSDVRPTREPCHDPASTTSGHRRADLATPQVDKDEVGAVSRRD